MRNRLLYAAALLLGGCASARSPCESHLTPINPPALMQRIFAPGGAPRPLEPSARATHETAGRQARDRRTPG